ncbi:MAG: hypothetical protein ACYDBJ_08760 [Aggregatilineales bacterium]
MTIAYLVLTRHEPYPELGGNYFDERHHTDVVRRLGKRLEKLGFDVTLQHVIQTL